VSEAAAHLRVHVDRDACMGSQSCVWRAPNTFRIEDGKATAVDPPGDPVDALRDAEGSCPGFAIRLEER
jgi:ferredoxin